MTPTCRARPHRSEWCPTSRRQASASSRRAGCSPGRSRLQRQWRAPRCAEWNTDVATPARHRSADSVKAARRRIGKASRTTGKRRGRLRLRSALPFEPPPDLPRIERELDGREQDDEDAHRVEPDARDHRGKGCDLDERDQDAEQHHFGHRPAEREARIDRKSTRLNSSHQIISYAVFSLKKKKVSIMLIG